MVQRLDPAAPPSYRRRSDHALLVLQGGGALGAYQAGVYEALPEDGFVPDRVTGVSIGAINAAPIAGNPQERRVARMREFRDRVSSGITLIAPAPFDPLRRAFNTASATASAAFGIPGFFYPRNLDQVLERVRDIQYSSKTRFNTTRVKDLEQFNEALRRVLACLPASMKDDPDVRLLADASRGRKGSVVQLINRCSDHSSQAKDHEFSRATVRALWESGRDAVRRTMASPDWPHACAMAGGLCTFDLAP